MKDEVKEICKVAAHSTVIARYSKSNALHEIQAVDSFFTAYFYAIKDTYKMNQEELDELCRAAAHSAVIARFSTTNAIHEKDAVDIFFKAYTYAMEKLKKINDQLAPQNNNKHI